MSGMSKWFKWCSTSIRLSEGLQNNADELKIRLSRGAP